MSTNLMWKIFFGFFKNHNFSEKSVPWILLTACGLAFGVLIPKLGYYQDDWVYVYNHFSYGNAGIIEFLKYDGRPFAAWVYILGFNILGYRPIAWHIATLVIKWLTAIALWATFRTIWPKNEWQNLTATLFFVAYPFFTLQPLAVAYILHWTGYLLYGLSMYFMLKSLKKRFWAYTLIALLSQIFYLFSLEYFSGIDLLRLVFLWLAIELPNKNLRKKFITTLKHWGPYLIIFIFFFVWRGFIYEAPSAGRNAPVGLTALLANPISTFISISLAAIPDLVLILISSWYKILEPGTLDFISSINRYSFMIGLASFLVFFYYLSRQNSSNKETGSPAEQMLFVGSVALLLGLVPVYVAGYEIHTKLAPWNSRFSLGSLFGAALIITGLIDIIVKVPKTRWILISTILGLLVSWHLRSTNDFRWGWDKQVNFYRQLYLRAPMIEPHTALLSEEEFLIYMGNYSTSYGINLIYANEEQGRSNSREADYWLFTYAEFFTKLDEYLNGASFSIGTNASTPRAGISFQGEPNGSIVISFEPGLGQCLWVMRPEYAQSKAFPKITRQLSLISNVDQIQEAPQSESSFLLKYLYTNPEQDWCYYYEKADLAYQYEDWDEVLDLWEAARQNDLQPGNGFELLPFIEAHARTNDWKTAENLTFSSQKTAQGIDPLLCDIWSKLESDTAPSTDKDDAILSVKEGLKCGQE